ncbi:MAG: adenylate/guanylate cyclase domain-containing protein [Deltaproteobacteria bacterium]|nr:adenylate/guanylate cyclase domain-containing protein [Deltaproteobacteria bacterium]
MSEASKNGPGHLGRLVDRIGIPLDWSQADRCWPVALILTGWWAFGRFILLNAIPGLRVMELSEADQAVIQTARFWTGLFVGIWGLLAVASFALRNRFPESRLWAHLVCQVWGFTFAVHCYAFGPTTSLMLGFVSVTGAIGGVLVLGWFPTLLGMSTFVGIGILLETAAWNGMIPYAPFFNVVAVRDGKLLLNWLLVSWPLSIFMTLLTMVLFGYFFHHWRSREEELAEAHVLLRASNTRMEEAAHLIRRYVPRQLAERIFSGDLEHEGKWERRKLTLFFSDIKGFTDASDELEAEDLSRVLNEYLYEMSAIAERYGATLDKFVGDAIMIFFGAPAATDDRDHALRCVRMALEMQARMGELARKWSDEGIENPFQIRIGINTGVATVGNFGSEGRMDYTAIGRQVNLAARLESSCTPGRILMSHSTWALVKDEIECQPQGEITVKGIHHPVKTYEAG